MRCPKCGSENTEQADYCTHCAEPLRTADTLAAQSKIETDTQQENVATQQSSKPIEMSNTKKAAREESFGASMHNNAETQPRPRITNVDIQSDKAKEKPVVSIGMYIIVILLSIPVPPIGLAMGYTYLRKPHPEAKKAGKIWLAWGIITFTTLVLLAII